MQLSAPRAEGPLPRDIAVAIREGAGRLGHRPAVSVLLAEGRQEQATASLAQWAAKGAHLFELDLLLGPGDEVRLDAPWSWTSAAVALGVWWAGGVVRLGREGDATVAVVGTDGVPGTAEDVYLVGDGIDGGPPPGSTDRDLSRWTRAAQPLPDQPPPAHASGEACAIRAAGEELNQAEALQRALDVLGGEGTVGLAIDAADVPQDAVAVDAIDALLLITLRPLVTDAPTVVVRGTSTVTARGDKVRRWATTAG